MYPPHCLTSSKLVFRNLRSSLHLHEQPLLAGNLSKHIVVVDEVVERRQPEANPAEIFQQGLGVGGAVDGHDKAVAAEVRQFAELEQGHEAESLLVGLQNL